MTQATHNDASVLESVREVVESAAAGKVFGAPITEDGVTVLPVAKVSGGGGGGSGTGPAQEGKETGGTGGGMGVSAKPLGVFVIKKGRVRWHPAIDVNKVIIGGQILGVIALLTMRAMAKARRRRFDARRAELLGLRPHAGRARTARQLARLIHTTTGRT